MAGVINVISDAYVLVIPELGAYRLKMQRRKKIVLFALFGSGAMVVSYSNLQNSSTNEEYSVLGAGIARAVWLSRLHTGPRRDLTCKPILNILQLGY